MEHRDQRSLLLVQARAQDRDRDRRAVLLSGADDTLVKNPALKPGERKVVQEAGPAGFSVEYTRKVYRGDDLIKDERYRTRYDPENEYVEVGPKKKPKPKPKPVETPKSTTTPTDPGETTETPPTDGGTTTTG